MANGFLNQLLTIKMYSIAPLMVDVVPKSLEFFLIEVIIQRVFLNFSLMTVINHIIQCMFIKDSLDQCMHSYCHTL